LTQQVYGSPEQADDVAFVEIAKFLHLSQGGTLAPSMGNYGDAGVELNGVGAADALQEDDDVPDGIPGDEVLGQAGEVVVLAGFVVDAGDEGAQGRIV